MALLKSATGKILRNSFWFGLETVIETVVFLGTSIALARYLGPAKLGYFSYINFFVLVVNRTSGSGLAGATRKYMSEYLALDQPGLARAVYHFAYKYQIFGAILLASFGIAGIALFGDPAYRLPSEILILSIVPGVLTVIPAQANQAFEDMQQNTLSAFGYLLSYLAIVLLSVHFNWDLVGIAAASLIGRTLEAVLRTIPLHRKLRRLPLDPLPHETAVRIRRFCLQAIGIQLLVSLVWDRSEMILLRAFSSLEQIAFYSVSFGLANNLLVVPRALGGATATTLMVEASRDPSRVDSIVKNAGRYLLLVALPVHLGAAAITRQAIGLAYGPRYAAAIPVLILASILSIPRAFQDIPDILLKAADRQKQLLHGLILTGLVNIALDALLIPHFGAVGAAIGNGLGQSFGVALMWQQARRHFRFTLPAQTILRFALAASLMALLAYTVGRTLPGLPGLLAAILTAIPTYILLVKLLQALESSDRQRLTPLANRLPNPLRQAVLATLAFVIP